MSVFVANKFVKMIINSGKQVTTSKVLILGLSFKENCPDIRNSKVIDVYNELIEFGLSVDVYDYEVDPNEVKKKLKIEILDEINDKYDGILLAVAHKRFLKFNISSLKNDPDSVVFDLKGILPRNEVNSRL